MLHHRLRAQAQTDPHYDKVSLLMNFSGTNGSTTFVDRSRFNHQFTRIGTTTAISTAQSKFGGSSLSNAGDNNGLQILMNDAFNFGSDDFTVECWVRPSSLPGSGALDAYCGCYTLATDSRIFAIGYLGGTGLGFYISSDGNTGVSVSHQTTMSTNTWYHVAAVRSGNSINVYRDGVKSTSTLTFTGSVFVNNTLNFKVANANVSNGYGFNGFVDDLRITKGIARYTATFTPPTIELRK